MNKIYLIGFMGAGKTTIGQKLSEILKLSFIDVDEYIEKKYETDIPTIFKTYGEERFREYEMISLKEDRKSTRLNSSHVAISYAVFCLKKKRMKVSWNGKDLRGRRIM